MFKYTKRLISDLRFWRTEFKLRWKEDAEFERIIDNTENTCAYNPMAGFNYYQTMNRNRAERKLKHQEERAAIK